MCKLFFLKSANFFFVLRSKIYPSFISHSWGTTQSNTFFPDENDFFSNGTFDLIISLKNVIVGVSVSTFIGFIAGFFPALFASNLDPVEAIRSN